VVKVGSPFSSSTGSPFSSNDRNLDSFLVFGLTNQTRADLLNFLGDQTQLCRNRRLFLLETELYDLELIQVVHVAPSGYDILFEISVRNCTVDGVGIVYVSVAPDNTSVTIPA